MSLERWSRGCGTGIGASGHKNVYRLGVTIENWVEDRAALDDELSGTKTLHKGDPRLSVGTTTMRADFTEEGKVGQNLLEIADRKDLDGNYQGCKKEELFNHGRNPQQTPWDTLNNLTYSDPRTHLKPRVHQTLWSGSKFNDGAVPVAGETSVDISTTKLRQYEAEAAASMYTTHNIDVFGNTAEMAKTIETKRPTMYPSAEGGQEAQVGRKATGPCVSSFDKDFNKSRLRG